MDNHLVVSANGLWYDLIYNLAFIVTLSVLIYEGYRRKFPMLKWIFLIAIVRLCFIAGTKIVTISPHDWNVLFVQFKLPEANDKSLAGGFLFGVIALFSGMALLRIRQNITDAFALVLPLGIAIQRAGCFLTGCCYGKISDLPWAVKYPVQTLPHFHQFSDKLLTYNDFLSLPVHPVQLYEMAGMMAVFIIVLKFRKRFKRPGSLFLLSGTLVFLVRFITEFFRDIHAHTIGGTEFGIFNSTQLLLLPLMLALVLILLLRERIPVNSIKFTAVNDFGIAEAFFLFLLGTTLFRALKSWFVFSEVIAISLTLFAAFLILAYRIVKRTYNSQYRWLYLAGLILPMFLMAQTYPSGQDSTMIRKYRSIKIGVAIGDFENSLNIGQGSGCDRVSQTEYFKQKYTVGAASFGFIEENLTQKRRLNYGVNAMFGKHNEIRISDGYEKNENLLDVNPYIKWDSNWLGIGGGLHLGNLTYAYENLQKEGTEYPESGSNNLPVYPQVYLRIGPQKWFYLDYHLADHFPSALPGYRHLVGIGSGLGQTNGTNLRFGTNAANMIYLSGAFVFSDRIVIEPLYMWGKSPWDYDSKNFSQFSLGIGYRFGYQDKMRAKTGL